MSLLASPADFSDSSYFPNPIWVLWRTPPTVGHPAYPANQDIFGEREIMANPAPLRQNSEAEVFWQEDASIGSLGILAHLPPLSLFGYPGKQSLTWRNHLIRVCQRIPPTMRQYGYPSEQSLIEGVAPYLGTSAHPANMRHPHPS